MIELLHREVYMRGNDDSHFARDSGKNVSADDRPSVLAKAD
jgi:hypothetical protein